jgi:ribose transport system substrate-binding protein
MKTNSLNFKMKNLSLLIFAAVMAVVFPGCDNKGGAPSAGGEQKKHRLAYVANTLDDFWSIVRLGCDVGTRQLGDVEVDFRFPPDRTAAAQQEILSALVASGVDGIVISPIDADSQTDFLNGIAAKALLVCVDSDAEKTKRACYIGTDNVAAGKQAAGLLKEALPQGGKVVLFVGYANAQNTRDRVQGFQDALAGSNIQIVDTYADGAKTDVAWKNAQDALTKFPDLAGMIGIYGYHGPAILTAVRGGGKVGKVKIVCFDEDAATLAGIAAGDIYGTIIQNAYEFGYEPITRMDKYLRGDKTQLANGKILIPTRTITKENVATFQASRKTILEIQAQNP